MQAQLAAFLLGDSNASSTALRSAAQLVQLLDSPPAGLALSQGLPAGSGYIHAPITPPASQVRLMSARAFCFLCYEMHAPVLLSEGSRQAMLLYG